MILFHVRSLSLLSSQTFEEQVGDFADMMNKSLPFAASMGLNWSNPYIGQLIGHPMHFGVGIALGSVFFNNTEPADLGELMGITIEDSMIQDKQWLPSYVFIGRLGGLGNIPFDFGFKFGYLPDMPLWGSLDYNTLIFGFDINYAVYISRKSGPVVVVGLGFDKLDGGANGTMATVPGGLPPVVQTGMPVHFTWESNTFKIKVLFSQSLLATAFSVFGGIDLGFGSNSVGVKFGENKDSPNYEDIRELSTLVFSSLLGFGYEINAWHIDLGLMTNFVNFELGLGLSVRYQP